MGKKGKRKTNAKQFALRDVHRSLRQKNHKLAFRQLVNAKLKTGQEAEADQLKAYLILAQATDRFQEHQYQDCIDYLDKNEFQVVNNEIFSNKVSLLQGMCYFYLGQFDIARGYLQQGNTNNNPLYHFYDLACLVYQAEGDIDFADLPDTAILNEEQRTFIQALIKIQYEDYTEAAKTLLIQSVRFSAPDSKDTLVSILQQPTSTEKVYLRAKPLYRALANAPLSESEATYLSRFSILTDMYQLSSRSATKKEIAEVIDKLCTRTTPLDASELAIALDAPDELHPAILYNQLILMFRNLPNTKNKNAIRSFLRQYYKKLVRVPEFVVLLSSLYQKENILLTKNEMQSIVLAFCSVFHEKLPPERIDGLGVSLVYTMHNVSDFTFEYLFNVLKKTLNLFPDLTAAKFNLFVRKLLNPDSSIDWKLMNLFNKEYSPVLKEFVFDELESEVGGTLRILENSMMNYQLPPIEKSKIKTELFNQIFDYFSEILIKHPPLKTENFPLEIVCTLCDYWVKITSNEFLEKEVSTKLVKVLSDYIEYFGERDDSMYRKYLQGYKNGNPRPDRNAQLDPPSAEDYFDSIIGKLTSRDAAIRNEGLQEIQDTVIEIFTRPDLINNETSTIMIFVHLSFMMNSSEIKKLLSFADVVKCVEPCGKAYASYVATHEEVTDIQLLLDLLELFFREPMDEFGWRLIGAFLRGCESVLMNEAYMTNEVRTIFEEYFNDLIDMKNADPALKIDNDLHQRLSAYFLGIENQSRRRRFKGVLKEFRAAFNYN